MYWVYAAHASIHRVLGSKEPASPICAEALVCGRKPGALSENAIHGQCNLQLCVHSCVL